MAGSFQDAFIKAGVVTQEDIDHKEKEREATIKKEKDMEIVREQVRDMERQDARNRRTEPTEPANPIDKLWRKNRSLMVHLIHAFIPIDKGHVAFDASELHTSNCCICRCRLISKSDLFKKIPELSETSLVHMKEMVEGTLTVEKMKSDWLKITDGTLGIVSKSSKTAFCNVCYREFLTWVQLAVLNGEPHINRIVGKMRAENEPK